MEIQTLKIILTESDLNGLVHKHLPDDQPLENIQVRVAPEGIYVKGVYPLFISVSFETLWEVSIQAGRLTARLASLRALGIPGNVFKSGILKLIADAAKSEDWIKLDKETLVADLDGMLLKNGLPARTNLTRLMCEPGKIILEAGT